jgi:hypothetical protein
MDIKDFLGEYVKPQALKLGGEGAINEVEAGLDGAEVSKEQIDGWSGDTVILKQTEGDRFLLNTLPGDDLYINGNSLWIGYKPVSEGSIEITNGNIGIAAQSVVQQSISQNFTIIASSNNTLNLRAGNNSGGGFIIQSNDVGVLKIILSDINGDAGLPTGTASLVANQLWNDNGTLKIYTP